MSERWTGPLADVTYPLLHHHTYCRMGCRSARLKASSELGVLSIVHHGPPLYVYLQKFAALTQQGRNSLQAAIIPLILISNAIDVGVGLLQALNPVVGPTSR